MSNKPLLDVMHGQRPERIPVWFMRQAGRYLPEYREIRAAKGDFLSMVYDPQTACEITMQPIRRFGMDGAILFSDILVIPEALGQKVTFEPGSGPKLDPIEKPMDVLRLNFSNFKDTLSPIYETIHCVRNALKTEGHDKTTLIGFAGGPWTLACYMLEGQGGKDFLKARTYPYKHDESFYNLIDMLVDATSEYLIQQVSAGAEVLQIFESWAGALEAHQFKRWVIEPTQRIIERVKSVHPHIKFIGFPKGAGYNMLQYSHSANIDAIAIDYQTQTNWAARVFQPQMPVQGNLDPACLLAGGDALLLAVERILADLGNGPFIFNLGHGIDKTTPIEHVEQAVQMIRERAI